MLKTFNLFLNESKIKLPEELINKLSNLPEKGMGYQIVDVELIDGTILNNIKVINSTYFLIPNSKYKTSDIKNIEIK